MHYDVFNGDADGIIALLQLRWTTPKENQLITGVKRDIQLLKQVAQKSDVTSVTVLDISMEKNKEPLELLISQGVDVFYCDHHRSGDIPESMHLEAVIDLDAEVCTSLLVNDKLNDRYINWTITAAFGDNLFATAERLASSTSLTVDEIAFLKELGTLINYNGYGADLGDLHIAPQRLYTQLLAYSDPLALREDVHSPYYLLKKGYDADYQQVTAIEPFSTSKVSAIYILPNEAWSRRISGVFGNELANLYPTRAHAVLTLNQNKEDYTVSVRAPIHNRVGADDVCCQFPTGGGRKAAAGINALPVDKLDTFTQTLANYYQ